MLATHRACFSLSGLADESSTSLNPMIPLSGVRSSWLTVERKSPFVLSDSYSAMFARARSSSRVSRSAFSFFCSS